MPVHPHACGEHPCPHRSKRSKVTALINSSPLEYVEITHPYHPFLGQKFPILKSRRVSGTDTLVLQGSRSGTFAVPLEWTDKGTSSCHITLLEKPSILDIQCLLALREIVNSFYSLKKGGLTSDDK